MTLYVTFRLWESRPDALVANEMRRDSNNIFQNDHIAFLLDTFYDRRNGIEFAINAIGGRWDGQITNERNVNGDWNPIWDLKVGRFDGGWTVETASRSSRSAIGPAARRSGASTRAASTAGRTRCRS